MRHHSAHSGHFWGPGAVDAQAKKPPGCQESAFSILLITFLAAFDHLGFDISFLSSTLGSLVTIIGAALALAFVFGSREAARNMLSGYYARERFRAGEQVKLDANVGELLGIGTLTSVVRTEEGDLVFPNHRLVESNVLKPNGDQG